MPNHPHREKRLRQSASRRLRNRERKADIRQVTTKVRAAIDAGDADAAQTALREATSALAKAAKGSTLHKKTAARKISRLTKAVNTACSS